MGNVGWGGSCRGWVGHVGGVCYVGWGGSCRDRVGSHVVTDKIIQ